MTEKLYRETPMRKRLREVALWWREQGELTFTLKSLAQAVERNPNQHVRSAVKQWVKEGWVFEYEYVTETPGGCGLAKAYTFLKPDSLPLPF